MRNLVLALFAGWTSGVLGTSVFARGVPTSMLVNLGSHVHLGLGIAPKKNYMSRTGITLLPLHAVELLVVVVVLFKFALTHGFERALASYFMCALARFSSLFSGLPVF